MLCGNWQQMATRATSVHQRTGMPEKPLTRPPRAAADDSPAGREIADIVPVGSRLRPPEHILNQMHSKPGKPYSEALIQEDVRRLHATKWFVPGSIEVRTALQPDGRVVVF